jgi:hypothetical protein
MKSKYVSAPTGDAELQDVAIGREQDGVPSKKQPYVNMGRSSTIKAFDHGLFVERVEIVGLPCWCYSLPVPASLDMRIITHCVMFI